MSKDNKYFNAIFWATFIGMALGGFMMVMLAAFMKISG